MIETAISFWADIKRYEDMLDADPRSYCFAPLSELYRKLGLLDDAVSVAKKGCALHPDYPGGFLALAGALLDKGEKAAAREALERVVAASPDNLRAQKLLSQIYADAGETALAQEALRHVLAENPDDAESALLLRTISATAAAVPVDEELDEVELLELELVEELEPEELFEAEELFEIEETGLPEEPAHPAPAAPPASSGGKDPLSTATMAELYVSQGFPEKALRIYRALLEDDPANLIYTRRAAELERIMAGAAEEEAHAAEAEEEAFLPAEAEAAPFMADDFSFAPTEEPVAFAPEAVIPAAGTDTPAEGALRTVAILEEWLENIRRRRQHAL